MNNLQTMDAIKQTLLTQQEQGQALLQTIEYVQKAESRIDEKVDQTIKLVDEVRERVHLDDGQATNIQKKVGRLSWEFATRYFEEKKQSPSHNLFLSKVGQFRGIVYKHLKKNFKVTKYTNIRFIDYKKAMEYLDNIQYEGFEPWETRWTAKQLEIMEREGQPLIEQGE